MQNAIFSSSTESFMVNHVLHAGSIAEIPKDKQKNGTTHYFKLTTTRGAAFCRFRSEDAARRSRGMLGMMLGHLKPHLFKAQGECIDISGIVSVGKVVEFRNGGENDRFGLPVTLATIDEKSTTIWFVFKTEESGQNIRRALWANILSYYEPADAAPDGAFSAKNGEAEVPHVEEAEVVFSEV
jgi:hypothetical protein